MAMNARAAASIPREDQRILVRKADLRLSFLRQDLVGRCCVGLGQVWLHTNDGRALDLAPAVDKDCGGEGLHRVDHGSQSLVSADEGDALVAAGGQEVSGALQIVPGVDADGNQLDIFR